MSALNNLGEDELLAEMVKLSLLLRQNLKRTQKRKKQVIEMQKRNNIIVANNTF